MAESSNSQSTEREAETLLVTLLTSEIYSSDQVAKRHPLKQVKEPFQ